MLALVVLLHGAATHAHADAPAPHLGAATLRIAIDLDEWAEPDRVVVTLDGTALEIPRDAVTREVPVEAGAHLLTVSIGPDLVWSKQINLLPGDDELVEIAPEMAQPPAEPPPKKVRGPDDVPWPREFVLRPPTLKAGMVQGGAWIAGLFREGGIAAGVAAARAGFGVTHGIEVNGDVAACVPGFASCALLQLVGGVLRMRVLRRGHETLTLRIGLHSHAVVESDARALVTSLGGGLRTHSRRVALAVDFGASIASGDPDATGPLGGYNVGVAVARQVGGRVAFEVIARFSVPKGVEGAYRLTVLVGAFYSVAPRIDLSVGVMRPVAVGPNSSELTTTQLTFGAVARY